MEEVIKYSPLTKGLEKVSSSLINCTANKNLVEYTRIERSLTLQSAIEGKSITNLIKFHGDNVVHKALYGALEMNQEFFNVSTPMTANQCVQTGSLFMEHFQYETFEDLVLCLKKAKLGEYGKTYNRIDGQVIFEWFKTYLDEKYQEVERLKRLERDQRMEETTEATGGVGIRILEEIKSRQVEPGPEYIQPKSEQRHWENFNQVIKRATLEMLNELLDDYKKHQKGGNTTVEPYITAIESEILNLKS
jgi:hypothetical protein